MDADIKVCFDGQDGLSFIQGEDRTVTLCFTDRHTGMPVDLSGGYVSLILPRLDGTDIVRTSQAYALTSALVSLSPAPGVITFPNHGLVTGDSLVFTGASLPAPLVAATSYRAKVLDSNTLSLTDGSGNPITLTSVGSGSFSFTAAYTAINAVPQTGCALVTLTSAATSQVAAGRAQSVEVDLLAGGQHRSCVLAGALDVTPRLD